MDNPRPTILYLDTVPGDRIYAMKSAGVRRYAAARGWNAVAVPEAQSRPRCVPALLEAHGPLAGCIVDGSEGHEDLVPGLFGGVPVVYLDFPREVFGPGTLRITADNAAIARAAFRELSLRHPEAYAVVGFRTELLWTSDRESVFRSLAAGSGKPCLVFPRRREPAASRTARLAAWTARLPRRTAVFATNDDTAAEVAAAARAAGRRIPRDLALLGVDNNVAVCEASRPRISSVQVDFERAGYMAAKMVGEGLPPDARAASATYGPLLSVRRGSTRGAGRRAPHVLAAVETIRLRACEGIVPRDVVARSPGSRSLFFLRFREATGHTVLEEIRHVRLERVCTLLSRTDTAISAIAGLCGYRSDIALRKQFRLHMGMSMREWRAKNRR